MPPPLDVPLTSSVESTSNPIDVAATTEVDDEIPLEPPKISSFSSLPVALVVEQTARILEDIKRKIQLQKVRNKIILTFLLILNFFRRKKSVNDLSVNVSVTCHQSPQTTIQFSTQKVS